MLSQGDINASLEKPAPGIDPSSTQAEGRVLEDGTQAKNDERSDGFAVEAVLARLGEARLSKYLARAEDRALALALYEWNADIASALHFPMQQLEICKADAMSAFHS